jgi:hypothetical protein
MERRVRSDAFTSLLAVIEGDEEAPEIRFDFHALTRGLEYVVEIRQREAPSQASIPPPRT